MHQLFVVHVCVVESTLKLRLTLPITALIGQYRLCTGIEIDVGVRFYW